jgi:FdhE protein
MADNLLRRWLGGTPAVPPDVAEARAELDRLAADRPALVPLVSWLREMLPDLVAVTVAPVVELPPDRARAKLQDGTPLLRGELLKLDAGAFDKRWQRACTSLAVHQPDGVAAAFAGAVQSGRLDPAATLAAVLGGRPELVREQALCLSLDSSLAVTLLRFTLFPIFTALAASLAAVREGVAWERGYCPTCGGWPLLGEFRGLEQARFLRCGLCASGWEVPRLWCSFCGSRDHEVLRFLHGEGEEAKTRALVCEGCRGYVKMVSTLAALPPLRVLTADVATLHLDLAAAERGYTNPPCG